MTTWTARVAVVDDAFSVEVRRQRGHERLAFAGDHFGDVAFVQDHAAHELHVVVPQADEPPARLAANGEGLDQDVVERFAGFQPAAELGGLAAQLVVGHRLVLRLQRVDRLDLGLQPLQEPRVGGAEQAGDGPLESAEDGVADRRRGFPRCVREFP